MTDTTASTLADQRFTFPANSKFWLTAQVLALNGEFPVFSTDVSPIGNPQTFDIEVRRMDTEAVVKSIVNQPWLLGTNFFDTPQTDYQWDDDAVGYNVRHEFDPTVIFSTQAAVPGVLYRVRITGRTATQGIWTWDRFGTATQ